MNKLISVIIPTYNRGSILKRAITSVLEQSYDYIELIVVDDGSTDNTKEVIESFSDRLRYVFQVNQGVSAARNLGIELSKGDFIAFLDSDDEWFPEKLEKQIKVLCDKPEIALVLCDCIFINSSQAEIDRTRRRELYPKNGYIFQDVLLAPYLIPPTVLLRRQTLNNVGYFKTHLKTAEDIDLFLRIAKREQVYLLDEPLVRIMRDNNGLGDSTSTYDDHLMVVLQCVEKNKEIIPKRVRKKCLFNCYHSYIKGKIWQKDFFAATRGVCLTLRYVTTLSACVEITKIGLTLTFHFVKNKLNR